MENTWGGSFHSIADWWDRGEMLKVLGKRATAVRKQFLKMFSWGYSCMHLNVLVIRQWVEYQSSMENLIKNWLFSLLKHENEELSYKTEWSSNQKRGVHVNDSGPVQLLVQWE